MALDRSHAGLESAVGRSAGLPELRAPGFASLLPALWVASALCVLIEAVRERHAGDAFYRFLDWNLFLAWIPFLLALATHECARRGYALLAVPLGVLWLLFFPNAPYMLTDFIHLQESPTTPLWYDGLMLSSFAWTALVLGFVSLYLMQAVWRRAAGPAAGWLGVVGALALASLGVYIGRYIGFNSWDALLRPERVARVIDTQLENPFHHPRLVESLVVLTGCLTVAYTVFYSFAGLRLRIDRR